MKHAEFGQEPEESKVSSAKNQRNLTPSSQDAPQEYIAEHTVKEDETLSHLALRYYGSTDQAKWMVIYQANQAEIGDNPAILRPGLKLKIPKLPA